MLYCDGGSRGNPGPAGAGFVIYDKTHKEVCVGKKFLGETTNNVAEYTALLLGLNKAKECGIQHLSCFLDSELVVKQLHGEYRVKHPNIKPLFARVQALLPQFSDISFSHIPRSKNARADSLANEAMDKGER